MDVRNKYTNRRGRSVERIGRGPNALCAGVKFKNTFERYIINKNVKAEKTRT